MSIRYWITIIVPSSLIAFSSVSDDFDPVPYQGKTKVETKRGYVLSIDTRKDPKIRDMLFYTHQIKLYSHDQLIWSKKYVEQENPLWRNVYFVPIRKGRYFIDLNNDGYEEVAILPWYAGQAHFWTAQIFTIKEDHLALYGTGRYNLEFGPSVLLSCPRCSRFAHEECRKCR